MEFAQAIQTGVILIVGAIVTAIVTLRKASAETVQTERTSTFAEMKTIIEGLREEAKADRMEKVANAPRRRRRWRWIRKSECSFCLIPSQRRVSMDPQTPIQQVPDEKLATLGWNLREQQDAHRRQVDVIEQQLQTLRAEFQRRTQVRLDAEKESQQMKATSEDAMIDKLMAKLAERNGSIPQNVTSGKTDV